MPNPWTDPATIGEAIDRAAVLLEVAGCETPLTDAAAIVAAALDRDVEALDHAARHSVPPAAQIAITACVNRRMAAEPLPYILRRCQFRSLDLEVDRRVMIPTSDSYPLVDVAHRLPRGSSLADVGTGCGNVALAAKRERPDLHVTASDVQAEAVTVARANARRLNLDVRFAVQPWLPSGHYDLVVANLPHVDLCGKALQLPDEITRHQPREAIFAVPDALTVIIAFLMRLPPRTLVAVQHAPSQTRSVRAWLDDPETLGQGARYDRVTVGRLP